MHDAYNSYDRSPAWSRSDYPAQYYHRDNEYRHRREYDFRTSPEVQDDRNSAERRSYDRNTCTNSSTRKKMNDGYKRNVSPEWSRSFHYDPATDRNTTESDNRYEKYDYKQDEYRRRRRYDFSTDTEAHENRNTAERPSYDRNTNSSIKRYRPGDIKYQTVSENEERRKDGKHNHRKKHESRHNSRGSSVDARDRKKRKRNDVDRLKRDKSSTLVTVQISQNEAGTKEDPEKENHCDKVSVHNVDKENTAEAMINNCEVTIAVNNLDKDNNSDEVSANVETESGCVEVEVASINKIEKENNCDKVSIQVNNVDEEHHSEISAIVNIGRHCDNVASDTDKNNEVSVDVIKENNCNETSHTVDKENSGKKRKYSTSSESKDKTKNKKSKLGESVTDHRNGDIICSILGKKTVSERTVAPSTIHTEKIQNSKPSAKSDMFFKKNNQRVSLYSRKENLDSSPSCAKKISAKVNNKHEKVDNTLKSQKKYSVPSDKINNLSQSNSIGAGTQNGNSEKLKATVKQNVSPRKSAIPIGRKKKKNQ